MESCHDSENAEKILYKMRPTELVSVVMHAHKLHLTCGAKTVTSKTLLLQVDVMKDAYKQGLQSEDDDDGMGDEIKPKDVGHNIYILAHQVKEKIKLELV